VLTSSHNPMRIGNLLDCGENELFDLLLVCHYFSLRILSSI
jgi:hypothetical protein